MWLTVHPKTTGPFPRRDRLVVLDVLAEVVHGIVSCSR
jgi:hypothetical protein